MGIIYNEGKKCVFVHVARARARTRNTLRSGAHARNKEEQSNRWLYHTHQSIGSSKSARFSEK